MIEDIDFSGYFCQPDNAAFRRYIELYTGIARRRGGEANIGPRLPALLGAAGFVDIEVTVVQHVSLTGEVKLLAALTMENIADAVLSEGLAQRDEIDALITELYKYANMPDTIGCTPRIFEVLGRRPIADPR